MNPALTAIIGLSALSLIGGGLIVALEIARPGGEWNSQATYTIIGITAPTMAVLLSWLKSVTNGRAIAEVSQEVKATKQAAVDAVETASLRTPPKN